jgi:cAMP phosphodiesterase
MGFNPSMGETKVHGNNFCPIAEFKNYKNIKQDIDMNSLTDCVVDHILGLNIKVPEISLKSNVTVLVKVL